MKRSSNIIFVILQGVVCFVGILVLGFLEYGLLSYMQYIALGVKVVCCLIVTICLMLLIVGACVKFLEWVVMR